MIPKMLIFCYKKVVPLFIGLWLGIAFSLMFAPFFDDSCVSLSVSDAHYSYNDIDANLKAAAADAIQDSVNPRKANEAKLSAGRRTNSLADNGDAAAVKTDDFEPRIRNPPTVRPRYVRGRKKLLRARYAFTELRIREKLFVGVLTSAATIDGVASALNRTLAHLVPKTVFFTSRAGPALANRAMSTVVFASERPSRLALNTLSYVDKHFGRVYDWFYFVPDTTYVRGRKLLELVESLSISQDVHMGGRAAAPSQRLHCAPGSGVILSNVGHTPHGPYPTWGGGPPHPVNASTAPRVVESSSLM